MYIYKSCQQRDFFFRKAEGGKSFVVLVLQVKIFCVFVKVLELKFRDKNYKLILKTLKTKLV